MAILGGKDTLSAGLGPPPPPDVFLSRFRGVLCFLSPLLWAVEIDFGFIEKNRFIKFARSDYLYGAIPNGAVFAGLAHVWLCSVSNVSDDPHDFVMYGGVIHDLLGALGFPF